MKRILVYNVAASTSGALTILNEYYDRFALDQSDTEYIFVISTPILKDRHNIKVLRYPWVKKSWLHRLYFEYFRIGKIAQEYKVDEILSLQNIAVPNTGIRQTVYLHQAIPFVEYKFYMFKDFIPWIYQNIISRLIYSSLKKAGRVIVQTKWMKTACVKRVGISEAKIIVEVPKIDLSKVIQYREVEEIVFFYPATALSYKNHMVIVEACKILKQQGIFNYKVIFTTNGNENGLSKKIKKVVDELSLPVSFIGSVERSMVFELYSKTILLFPSYVESLSLPLLEAKTAGCPIIAADTLFARDVLSSYYNVMFFEHNDYEELAVLLLQYIKNG